MIYCVPGSIIRIIFSNVEQAILETSKQVFFRLKGKFVFFNLHLLLFGGGRVWGVMLKIVMYLLYKHNLTERTTVTVVFLLPVFPVLSIFDGYIGFGCTKSHYNMFYHQNNVF